MDSYLRQKLTRKYSVTEKHILADAGEATAHNNIPGELPEIGSMKSFIMLCSGCPYDSVDKFWKEYRLLSECLDDTSKYYTHFQIPKRSGSGSRHIFKVDVFLAAYQKDIKRFILDPLDSKHTSEYAFAYRKGISIIDNAKLHAGHDYLVKMDIEDFFDNTSQSKVYGVFSRYTKYNKAVKTMLTKLVCLNRHLSQGSCTSPQLANLVLIDFDTAVSSYCKALGITYTRYCDDLAFSSSEKFDTKALISFVTHQLKLSHYRPNNRKTKILGKGTRHIVTGILVNNKKLKVPSEYKHELRQEMYYIRKYGIISHLEHADIPGFSSTRSGCDSKHEGAYIYSLQGRVAFALSVDPDDRELAKMAVDLEAFEINYQRDLDADCHVLSDDASKCCRSHPLYLKSACTEIRVDTCCPSGLLVHVSFCPKDMSDYFSYECSKRIVANNAFPYLKNHSFRCGFGLRYSFIIPTGEIYSCEKTITGCLNELLKIYETLDFQGCLFSEPDYF